MGEESGYIFVDSQKLEELKARASAMEDFKAIADEAEKKSKATEIEVYQKVITMFIRELAHPIILKREDKK